MAVLNFRCISWMLQTSLDNTVRLSALKHLSTTVMTPASFDPTLVAGCFNTFLSCVTVDSNGSKVVIIQGLEELATESAIHFFTAISHISVVDPTSTLLKEVIQHYDKVFPIRINFQGHQSYHTMHAARRSFVPLQGHVLYFQWSDYKPSTYEHTIVAHNLLKLAQFKYKRAEKAEVPKFILHFVFYSLSLDPPPPMSVIANCLLIIAIELGHDVLETGVTTLDERCVYL